MTVLPGFLDDLHGIGFIPVQHARNVRFAPAGMNRRRRRPELIDHAAEVLRGHEPERLEHFDAHGNRRL